MVILNFEVSSVMRWDEEKHFLFRKCFLVSRAFSFLSMGLSDEVVLVVDSSLCLTCVIPTEYASINFVILLPFWMRTLQGEVVFTSGPTSLPEGLWYFEMDSWEVFQGGLAAYRVDRTSEFEDPGLFFYIISGAHSVEEIPVGGRGTSFLGGGGASYILAPVTVIEYPATTIGLKFASDQSGWTFELWYYGLPGNDFDRPLFLHRSGETKAGAFVGCTSSAGTT